MSEKPSKARTWNGHYVNIAHRRTPSELTPLIQQNLALQQQVELLTVQNQHMMHQQQLQQNLQHQGLLPPPSVFHTRVNSHQQMTPSSPHHNRQRSMGHTRRHSLAVSEAKKYAAERSTTQSGSSAGTAGTPSTPQSSANAPVTPVLSQLGPPPLLPSPQPPFGSPGPIETPQFRFPPSPDRARSHSRSQSMTSFRRQTPSPQRFQFPPSENEGGHHRTGSHQRTNSNQFSHQRANSQSLQSPHYYSSNYNGGGHSRKNSGWEGHRPRASNASDFSPAGRKSLFVPYLPQSTIPEMLSDGLLVTGTLRVNHKNRSYAYVSTDLLDADVLIDGSKDRNRALEGDLVAVELLDVDDVWEQKKEKEERKRRRESQQAEQTGSSNDVGGVTLRRQGSLKQRPPQKRHDDVDVEGQTLLLREELWQGDEKPLYCGHVVAVLERPAGQLFSGTLGLLRPSSQATKERQMHQNSSSVSQLPEAPKIVWFKPTDKCVPLMAIPTEQAPQGLIENPQEYTNKIFVGQIKRWPITSLHPFGTLVETLGPAGSPDVAEKAILRDFNFGPTVFSEAAISEAKCVGEKMQQTAKELPRVKAFLFYPDLCASVSNVDDVKVLTLYVLDLSLISKTSQLNKEIRHKSAGVYMNNFESPLLPKDAQKHVEFQVGRLSPAISVEINLETMHVDVNCRAVDPQTLDFTSADYSNFVDVASALRKRRGLGLIDDKCVDMSALLDVSVPAPISPLTPPSREQKVVNELVHAANSAIASELLRSKEVGLSAIVRRQSEPSLKRLEQFAGLLRSQGVKVDTSNAQTLARSLGEQLSPRKAVAIKALLVKLLSQQRYAVAAKTDPGQLGHYWFGFDAYTHFARPLLRYADQVVARQVHEMLKPHALKTPELGTPGGLAISTQENTPTTPLGTPTLSEEFSTPPESRVSPPQPNPTVDNTHLAPELSFRYDCARSVQEQSAHLALANSLNEDYKLVSGIVVAVYESAFDIVVPEMSVEKRVHGDQLPLVKAEFYPEANKLELYWMKGVDSATYNEESSKPQPSIPDELKKNLVLKENIQEISVLCEVPILIKANRADRVLPSITVRAANPMV